MKIAIVGAGNVGSILGSRWLDGGHQVTFGLRDPNGDKAHRLRETFGTGHVTTTADAIRNSDNVVLAIPWLATETVVRSVEDWTGKTIVDCTNPLKPDLSGLSLGHSTSAGEMIAQWAQGGSVVKCFNSTGSGNMANPDYNGRQVSMLLCGDDEAAKSTVVQLVQELGFEAIDAGGLEVARLLEPLAMLWITLAYKQGLGPEIAFELIRR